jgi:hypothetical protein
MNLSREEIERLIGFSQWMFDDGMVNFIYEDMIEFERIKKKWETKE